MTDRLTPTELAANSAARARGTPEYEQALSFLTDFARQQAPAAPPAPAAPAGAPGASATPAPARRAAPAPVAEYKGFWSEAGRAVVGGIADAAQGTIQTAREVVGSETVSAPWVDGNATTAGKVAREIVSFLTAFAPAMKAVNVASKGLGTGRAVMFGRATAAGAAADVVTTKVDEDNFAKVLAQIGGENPLTRNAIVEYLANDADDSPSEQRFKNALIGAGLGGVVEGVVQAVRTFRAAGRNKELRSATESAFQAAEKQRTAAPAAPAAAGAPASAKPATEAASAPSVANVGPPTLEQQAAMIRQRKQRAATARIDAELPPVPPPPVTGTQGELVLQGGFVPPKARQAAAAMDALDSGPPVPRATEAAGEQAELFVRNPVDDNLAERVARTRVWVSGSDLIVDDATEEAATRALVSESGAPLRPLDDAIVSALAKPGFERSAEDLTALRLYERMQDSAVAALRASVMASPEPSSARLVIERQSARDAAEQEAMQAAARGGAAAAEATADAVVERVKRKAKDLDDLMAELESAQAKITSPVLRAQGGFASPALLAQLAASGIGGLAGWNLADEDASLTDRAASALIGIAAGAGAGRVLVRRAQRLEDARTVLDEKAAKKAADEAYAEKLATGIAQGVGPLRAVPRAPDVPPYLPKKTPVITPQMAESMRAALESGDAAAAGRAFEDATMGGDFNFANIDSTSDVRDVINAFSAAFQGLTQTATRGTRTFDQIEELARDIGASPEQLKTLYGDTTNLAERVLGARALLAASAERLVGLGRALEGVPPASRSSEDILAWRKQIAIHATIQAEVKGVQTEVARALASFRIQATSADLARREVDGLIDLLGGRELQDEILARMGALGDDHRLINAVSRRLPTVRTQGALFEVWVNGILSGLGTHLVNVVGNGINMVVGTGERAIASFFAAARRDNDGPTLREAAAYAYGLREGLMDALRVSSAGRSALAASAKAFAKGDVAGAAQILQNAQGLGNAWRVGGTGVPILDSVGNSAAELAAREPAVTARNFGMGTLNDDGTFDRNLIGAFTDVFGSVVRTPGRMLQASDEMFKTAFFRGEIRAQALRIATREKLAGDAFTARVAELLENPTSDMIEAGFKAARDGTFTTHLGERGAALARLVEKVPPLQFIIPFIRTPLNILHAAGRRFPVTAPLYKDVREALASGGPEADLAKARLVTGSLLMFLGGGLAHGDRDAFIEIVGGGDDKRMQAEKVAGFQPYSIRVGNSYYSFNRLDPLGMILGASADIRRMAEAGTGERDLAEAASVPLVALFDNLASKTFLKGVIDFFEVAANPQQYGDKWVRSFIASFVPSIVAETGRLIDPTMRDATTVLDAIKARVPGMTDQVPPRMNVLGEEIRREGGITTYSPVWILRRNSSPLAQEIARLNTDGIELPPRRLGGTYGRGEGVDLTPWEYHRMVKLIGEEFKRLGEATVTSPQWAAVPEVSDPTYFDSKDAILRRLWASAQEIGKAKFLAENPQIQQLLLEDAQNRARALGGQPPIPFSIQR